MHVVDLDIIKSANVCLATECTGPAAENMTLAMLFGFEKQWEMRKRRQHYGVLYIWYVTVNPYPPWRVKALVTELPSHPNCTTLIMTYYLVISDVCFGSLFDCLFKLLIYPNLKWTNIYRQFECWCKAICSWCCLFTAMRFPRMTIASICSTRCLSKYL